MVFIYVARFFWFLFICALISIGFYVGYLIYKAVKYHRSYKEYVKEVTKNKNKGYFPDYEIAFMPLKIIRTLYRLNPNRWKFDFIKRGSRIYTDDAYITYTETTDNSKPIYVIFTPTALGFRIFQYLCKKYEKEQKKKAKREQSMLYNVNLMKILEIAQDDIDNVKITVAKQRKECAETVAKIQKRLKDSEHII